MRLIIGMIIGMITSRIAFGSSIHNTGASHIQNIPVVVLYQAINVAIIIIGSIYFGKQKVIEFFLSKRNKFLQAQEKSQIDLRKAEHEHHEVKTRLDKLKVTRDESLLKAKADAIELKNQLISDAQKMVKKLNEEAILTAKIENDRAKKLIREHLIRDAIELSKKDLMLKTSPADQRKLQDDFIAKVGVAL